MKSRSFFLLLIFFSLVLRADTLLKSVYQYPSRYHHGSLQPGYDIIIEWWIGRDTVTLISTEYRNYENYLIDPGMRIVFDRAKQRVIVANTSNSTFAVFPLNIDADKRVDPELAASLNNFRVDGTVSMTGENAGNETGESGLQYHITESLAYGPEPFYERERNVSVATDLPFNMDLVDDLLKWIRSFFNPAADYEKELGEMKGLIWSGRDVRITRGTRIESTFKTIMTVDTAMPAEYTEIPAGFSRVDKLSGDDVMALRRIVFQSGG